VPAEISLEQNYPNPFNPTTTIKYSISSSPANYNQKIKLVIYDMLGNEISTLVDKLHGPNTYEINFDGSTISSGIYYYRLITSNKIITNKMVLLK